jgi:hypothetical protein
MRNHPTILRGSHGPLGIVAIIALAIGLVACSSAGPFVTHVEPLPGGALRVRRCMVEHHWAPIGDSVAEGTCTESVLRPGGAS